MSVSVKICGIKDEAALNAAVEGGAHFVGFNFYPPSPRAVTIEIVEKLVQLNPVSIKRVGLFVNPLNEDLDIVCSKNLIDIIQLHGGETPGRAVEIRRITGLPVMKAIRIADKSDLKQIDDYKHIVDMLLFDTKTDASLPGGSGKSFDWKLLKGINPFCAWMLAGGINANNIKDAVVATGASVIDVSSGVEDAPGQKNPQKIRELLAVAAQL